MTASTIENHTVVQDLLERNADPNIMSNVCSSYYTPKVDVVCLYTQRLRARAYTLEVEVDYLELCRQNGRN